MILWLAWYFVYPFYTPEISPVTQKKQYFPGKENKGVI
jgi:hypothetical protein